MPSAGVKPEAGWLRPALALVGVLTALRLAALVFGRTDLFVDEAQYWLWGQNLDFGYYSKPPLIGWVIRAFTEVAGSAPWAVRAPGPLFHAATALILGALGARIGGARAGFWAAALYVSAPFVTVGSALISTDTILAPAFAGALYFAWRTGEDRRAAHALAAGACAGAAFLAKYAAIYLIPGLALAALLAPGLRPGWRNAALMAAAFALVISPNVVWNLTHQLTTVEHTMDNVGWVRSGAGLKFGSMAAFFGAQFAVFGPVSFAALLWAVVRPGAGPRRWLAPFAAIPVAVVTVQALLDKAYANWAVTGYFAGTVLVALILPPVWRRVALGLNLIVALALPALLLLAPWPEVGGKPLLKRYLGRAELSTRILALARAEGVPVYATDRDILADLFYTGRDSGVTIYAPRPGARARNYYEQTYPLPEGFAGRVLWVRHAALDCGAGPVPPAGMLSPSGAWAGKGITPYLVEGGCIDAAD